MGQLTTTLKIFSGSTNEMMRGAISGIIPIRTNILKRNGSYDPISSFGSTSSGIIQLPDKKIPTFQRIIEEVRMYESYELTENIMKILLNNIVGLIDEDREVCEILNDPTGEKTKKVNSILKENEITDTIKESISDIIYYGSVSYLSQVKTGKQGKRSLIISDLKNPYSVIIRKVGKKETYILKYQDNIEVDGDNLIYIGPADFKLETPVEDFELVGKNEKTGSLGIYASQARYYASKPLYYSVTQKIKEYLLKDIMSTILSLKDAIQQTFLTMNMDISRNGSSTAAFDDAATSIESLINRSNDDAITLSEVLQLDILIQRVLSSVRVLPDPGGTLAQMQALNLDEIKDKVNRLKEGLNDLREGILDAVGIPRDLYDGSTNSYESMQKNERLDACISKYLFSLKESIKELIVKVMHLLDPNMKLSKDDIRVTLFRKSPAEFSRDQREMNALKDSMDVATGIMDSASQTIENNQFVDKTNYFKYIKTSLKNINKDIGGLIKDKIKFQDTGNGEEEDIDLTK